MKQQEPKTPRELVFDKLGKIEGIKKLTADFGEKNKLPAWHSKVGLQLLKVYIPGLKLTKATMDTPFAMGALMGHQFAMAKLMTPDKLALINTHLIEFESKPVTPAKKFRAEREAKNLLDSTVPAIATVAQESLSGALNLPPVEMAEFMRGFEVGIKGATQESFKAHMDFTTLVYVQLLMGWQAVEKLGSVSELRNWLLERLPEINVGSESRIKKLCSRIGLKLRGRGRPRLTGK